MKGKELLGLIDLFVLAAAAALPGTPAAAIAASMVHQLTQSLRDLMDGQITEADLRFPSYEEGLAEYRAKLHQAA